VCVSGFGQHAVISRALHQLASGGQHVVKIPAVWRLVGSASRARANPDSQLGICAESRHLVGNTPAANLGPFPPDLATDWLADNSNHSKEGKDG
jgi:hypothetical protein